MKEKKEKETRYIIVAIEKLRKKKSTDKKTKKIEIAHS